METKQRIRSEIDEKYKWDLSSIYKTDEEFLKDLEKVKKEIKKIEKYSDNLISSGQNIYDCFEMDNKINIDLERLYLYAHLNNDSDLANQKYQKYVGLVTNIYSEYEKYSSFIIPSLMKIDYKKIEEYYTECPKLKQDYEKILIDIYKEKKHTLSEENEKLISSLRKSFDNSEEVFNVLTDSDFTFDDIKINKKKVNLNNSNYSIYISDDNRKVRMQAFDSLHNEFGKYINTLSKILSNNIEAEVCTSKVRNYKSALECSLSKDNIPVSIYHNLINVVSKNLKPLFEYYDMIKKILKLDELHLYDMHAPLLKETKKSYTFEEAKELVINSLSILGEEYVSILNKAFDERWIDVYSSKGKYSGGFSSGSYNQNPFILLNYEGELEDVSVLAHELGHSIHTYYSNKNLYQYSGYSIFVAEVASTVNELLLSNYILKNSKSKKEKLNILNRLLNLYKTTLFRQTMFAEFEEKIYNLVEDGDVLTSDFLCDEYYKLNQKYFGKNVLVDEKIKYEWARVPHFYCNFYVYMYATSICASTYIVKNILEDKNYCKKYLKFLSLGSTLDPVEELKTIGVDMNDSKIIEETINYFKEILDEFKKIYNEK